MDDAAGRMQVERLDEQLALSRAECFRLRLQASDQSSELRVGELQQGEAAPSLSPPAVARLQCAHSRVGELRQEDAAAGEGQPLEVCDTHPLLTPHLITPQCYRHVNAILTLRVLTPGWSHEDPAK